MRRGRWGCDAVGYCRGRAGIVNGRRRFPTWAGHFLATANGIEGRSGPAFLSATSLQNMTAQPSYSKGADSWWGFGVMVQDGGTSWWKTGSFPGTDSYVARF